MQNAGRVVIDGRHVADETRAGRALAAIALTGLIPFKKELTAPPL
jgi:hypothetical protein